MNKLDLLTVFNDQLGKFFDDIISIFPDDSDLKVAQVSLLGIRKANPKLIISIWVTYISIPYKVEIENGNIDFFINKDYSVDLKDNASALSILSKISVLRGAIKQLGSENLIKTIQHIKNLTKLGEMYYK